MIEPEKVEVYRCPVCTMHLTDESYEEALKHVNAPVRRLPLGLVYHEVKDGVRVVLVKEEEGILPDHSKLYRTHLIVGRAQEPSVVNIGDFCNDDFVWEIQKISQNARNYFTYTNHVYHDMKIGRIRLLTEEELTSFQKENELYMIIAKQMGITLCRTSPDLEEFLLKSEARRH